MRRPESHFDNHPGVRSGIFYILILLFLLQGIKWAVTEVFHSRNTQIAESENSEFESRLDTIRSRLKSKRVWTLRPLDPNYLEDYRGYLLGIPFPALDSLYAFRSGGGVLTGMAQVQEITGLPDSTCLRLSSFFFFPEVPIAKKDRVRSLAGDLNSATADQFMVVRGIGPVLSKRIVKFRTALGGFVSSAQLLDVYGLNPETAKRVAERFPLRSLPQIKKLDLNRASAKELSGILYLNWEMAQDLVDYRTRVGKVQSFEELHRVGSLPKDKIDRIALYLQL